MVYIYLVGEFPSASEYFIWNEVIELKKKGFSLQILSLKKGEGKKKILDELDGETQIIYPAAFLSFLNLFVHFRMMLSLKNRYFRILRDTIQLADCSFLSLLKSIKTFSISIFFLYRIRKLPVKLIHAHFLSQPSSVALQISQLSGIPFSCSAHAQDIYLGDRRDILRKIVMSSFTVTCTSANKRYLEEICGSAIHGKVHYNWHGIDLKKWYRHTREFTMLWGKPIEILTVARLVEKKGIIYLLEAIMLLKEQGCKLNLSIVGDGPLKEELQRFVCANDLSKHVIFFGSLPQRELIEFYNNADLFVLPCILGTNGDRDGLPNVLVEALASGVPTISTSNPGIDELIIHGQTGILVPEKSPKEIASAILTLLSDHGLCERISINGRKKVEQYYSLSDSIDFLANLMSSL